jgi:MFS family permease
VSRTVLSGAFSLRQVESGFLSPLVGYLVDRLGPRKVIFSGVLIAGTGMILISFSTNIGLFYLAFLLASIGIGAASHNVSWAIMVARWFKRKRGRATGLAMMGGALGGPAVLLISFLQGSLGWRTSVFWLGLGIFVVGIPLSLVARSSPEDYGYQPDGDTVNKSRSDPNGNKVVDENGSGRNHEYTVKEALRSRPFWGLVVILGAQQFAMSGLHVHQIAYFQGIGFTAIEAASILAIAFSVSAIGRLSVGILIDRYDWRGVLASIFVGHIIATLILTNVTTYWHALVFAVTLGLFHGMAVPSRPFIAGSIFGTKTFGTIWGVVDGAIIIVGLAGPIFLGWTFDTYGTYKPAFFVIMAVLTIATPLIYLVFRSGEPNNHA